MRQQGIPSNTFDAHHQQVMPPKLYHQSSSQDAAAFRPHSPALDQWHNAAAYDPSTSSPAFATFEQPFIQPPSAATQFPGALGSEQVVDNDQILADLPQKLYHLSIPMSRGLRTTSSSDSGYSGLAGALDLPVQTQTSDTIFNLPGEHNNTPSRVYAQVQVSSRQGYYDNPTSYASQIPPSVPIDTLTTVANDPSQDPALRELQGQGSPSLGYYDNPSSYVGPIAPSAPVDTSTTAADGTYQAPALQDFSIQQSLSQGYHNAANPYTSSAIEDPSTLDYMNLAALDASSTFFNAAIETGSANSAAGMNFYQTWPNSGLPEEGGGGDGQAEWGNMAGPSTW